MPHLFPSTDVLLSTTAPTLRKALKDVGTDLVANLNLLSEFSQRASETAAWWSWVRDDLLSSNSVLLSSPSAQWESIKSDWQEYYNIVRHFPLFARSLSLLTDVHNIDQLGTWPIP